MKWRGRADCEPPPHRPEGALICAILHPADALMKVPTAAPRGGSQSARPALRVFLPAGSQSAGQPNRAWAAPWGGALKPRLYAGRRVLKVRARTHGDRVRTRCCAVLFFFVSRGASLCMLGAGRPTGSEGRLWTRGSRVRIPPGPPLARDLKIPRRALFTARSGPLRSTTSVPPRAAPPSHIYSGRAKNHFHPSDFQLDF